MPQPPIPERDPIVTKSYALHYLIAAILMTGSLFWALWDEAYGQRPWKNYQEEFKTRYTAFLKSARSESETSLKGITSNGEYQKLADDAASAKSASKPHEDELTKQIADVDHRIAVVQVVYIDAKALIGADTYDAETTASASSKERKTEAVDKERKTAKYEVDLPEDKGKKYTYNDLEKKYLDLKQQKAALVNELAEAQKTWKSLEAKRDAYLSDHMVSLSPAQLDGLRKKYAEWDPKIQQINVADANIVDRCESCHMGMREPVNISVAAMTLKGHKPDTYSGVFVSHPDRELLAVHDPDKFGCTPCHQGNGRATTSVEKAHGTYEHWLWPMFKKENIEAGCQTCHSADMVLATNGVGQTINDGKDLLRVRGCIGCHRYEGYDKEPEDLVSMGQQIKQAETQQKENSKQADILRKQADSAPSNEEANRLNGQAIALTVANSKLAGRIEQLDLQSKSLLRDMKKVGPNLKDIRAKLNRNWIPVWLHKPTDFRPTTKMPNFTRLTQNADAGGDQIKAIAAYLWQNALKDEIPHAKPGDATHGKDLFETRGCLACHSIGEGDDKEGGVFAANLSRVGEKVNYDYLVRWIHDPRHRIRPYCAYEKKDIGPEDYAKKGLPYQFDLDHTTCPNDGHELQVQQMTVMPVLRLTDQDASDIATYLIGRKQKEPSSYPDAPFMEDAKLAKQGKDLIRYYGCAGCHEISGFEEEGRIGTELTAEGSKPLERLDFSLLTHMARNGDGEPIKDPEILKRLPDGPAKGEWYDHKGFFEHKLAQPSIYDLGKIKNENDKLRMPDPHLTKEQIRSITTFLLGSQETSLPASYMYKPEDARRDIQEGWWIVKKYNCMGCHQFYPGQQTANGAPTILETVPVYRDAKEKLPPKLLTEGARVDPDWLLRFLSNPALSQTDINRNGVRPYLAVRMPTFNFSPNELRKLVRFFQALSQQPQPYIPLKMADLTPKEKDMGRSLFSSAAAPCLKCHATGDPAHDKIATAPNFLLAKERLKPGWAERWIIDPQAISPGTSMPSNLFRKDGDHWVFNGPTPPAFQGYDQDHTKLLVRYIFELTPEEQRAVSSRMGKSTASVPAPKGTKTGHKTTASGATTGR